MTQLTPLHLEDGTTIYLQAAPPNRVTRDFDPAKKIAQAIPTLENTVRSYTTHIVNSFRQLSAAEVSEITLEFGVGIEGVTGLPYIASASADCNVRITVRCEFPKPEPSPNGETNDATSDAP